MGSFPNLAAVESKKKNSVVLLLQTANITLPQARRKKMIQDSLVIKSVENSSGKINPNFPQKIELTEWGGGDSTK